MKQYKRLTMPSLAKETTFTKDGLFSKAHFTSQDVVEDQITLDLPAMPYENQWRHQRQDSDTGNAFLPGTVPFTPRPTQSNGHANGNRNGHANGNQVRTFPAIPSTP